MDINFKIIPPKDIHDQIGSYSSALKSKKVHIIAAAKTDGICKTLLQNLGEQDHMINSYCEKVNTKYEPGCLYFSEISPRQNGEGYDIYIHYMFNKHINNDIKDKFIKMSEITLDEDIEAVNNISMNSRYRKPGNLLDPLETDIIHFYNWLEKNTK
jgi:hypothetical protein